MDEKTKLKIIGKLQAGCEPREIVRELRVPYPAVIKIAEQLEKEEDKEKIISTVKAKEIVEGEIVETEKLVKSIAKDDLTDLQLLDKEIRDTAKLALTRIKDLLNIPNLQVKELSLLVEALSKLQTAFFKSSSPNIQVINTKQYNEQALQIFQDIKKP